LIVLTPLYNYLCRYFMKMINFFKKKKSAGSSYLAQADQNKDRARFHELKVSEITRETPEAVSVAFAVPDQAQSAYTFLPGQYLTLEKEIQGEKVRRSYSLCSSPLDGELRVAIKEVEGGKFSTYANRELHVGERMQVMTPQGNFTLQPDPEQEHHYVAFAAGSGITPVYSILKTVLESEPRSRFTLFYGNKTSKTVIFKEQIEGLKNRYMDRLEVHHILSREDQGTDYLKGRLDADKCRHYAGRFFEPAEVQGYFLCGPGSMINSVSATLQELGVASDKVHFELFSSPDQPMESGQKARTRKKTDKLQSKVTVILDGEETHLELSSAGASVLDAALDAGADVPYACKGAVCCTCRARVLEGEVEMEMNYALEEEEVADGYVLTCQSHPRSERVVISYDE